MLDDIGSLPQMYPFPQRVAWVDDDGCRRGPCDDKAHYFPLIVLHISWSFVFLATQSFLSKYHENFWAFFLLCVKQFRIEKSVDCVMLSWVWVFFPLFRIYALSTKSSQYAMETDYGNSFLRKPSHQEFAPVTSVPRVDRAVIQKRADIATCAYVSGDAGMWQCTLWFDDRRIY